MTPDIQSFLFSLQYIVIQTLSVLMQKKLKTSPFLLFLSTEQR